MQQARWWRNLQNTPFVTYALLAITAIVYLLETVSGGSTSTVVLAKYGAMAVPLVTQYGQWWRFVTPLFVHIGLMHIAVNAVSVYYLGVLTERLFGHWRFLLIYLLSGVAGNTAMFVFSPNTISAGASTAIFGLIGAFLLLGDEFRDNPVIRQISRQFLLLAVLNLVFDLFAPGIGIAGHIGGLVGGFLVAGALGAPQLGQSSPTRRGLMAGVFIVVLVALLYLGYTQ